MKKTSKDKPKVAKKIKPAKKKTVLKSLKKLGKKSGLGKLSTTQKVVGGAALLAAGLGVLAQRTGFFAGLDADAPDAATTTDAAEAEQNLNSLDGGNV
ncbi:hypothetical protein [Hymenobacter amundsenii]|uniref:hypothetical protein n=1 Tax=Hymenobacter amundsenii TaxID=2006685 RepID=UPI0013FE2B3D|nr:hypothetical protein [Hymenobacter amundsenii]